MKMQAAMSVLRLGATFVAAVFAIPASAQNQATFHVITYLKQLGTLAGILEGSPGIFYSIASGGTNDRAFSMTPQGSETVIAAFPSSESPGPFVAGDDGRFYSAVCYPSFRTTSVVSVASVAGSKKVYPAQSVNPAFTQIFQMARSSASGHPFTPSLPAT
jgi:hypothetical protein